MNDPAGGAPRALKRAPFRAWLVTGPVGRLVGFTLDFGRALRIHYGYKGKNR